MDANQNRAFQNSNTPPLKPRPFEFYTADVLWTDPHISAQMLACHLDGEGDLASRNAAFIDTSVAWLDARFGLGPGRRVIDFGCGPGLYTSRIARLGASVTGIDFSSRSIEHAREQARLNGLSIDYRQADYLEFEPEGRFDLILMIMCDFCVLSPEQRQAMLRKFARLLSAGGRIVLDVCSQAAFVQVRESSRCEENLLNGFFSANPYHGRLDVFRYEEEQVSLDRYTIVEPDRTWEIYNWLKYFSVEALEREFRAAGLAIEEVPGRPFNPEAPEFAVVGRAECK